MQFIIILKCSPGEIHRSPSYPRGQLQVSLATQAPPFVQGGLHTTVKDNTDMYVQMHEYTF